MTIDKNSRPSKSTPASVLSAKPRSAWHITPVVASRLVVGLVCLGPLLAISLPEKPFEVWPWTARFADFTAGLIPGIDRLTEVSKMPQVTRLYMSLQSLLFGPIFFVLFLKFGPATKQSVSNVMRASKVSWSYFIFALILIPLGLWFVWDTPPSVNENLPSYIVLMSESRFWLGLFGSCVTMLSALTVFVLLNSFSLVRLAYSVRETSSPSSPKDSK